jgi:hypothetical protein
MSDEMHRPAGITILVNDDFLGDPRRFAAVSFQISQMNRKQQERAGGPVVDFDCPGVAGVLQALREIGVGETLALDSWQNDRIAMFETAGGRLVRKITAAAQTKRDDDKGGIHNKPQARKAARASFRHEIDTGMTACRRYVSKRGVTQRGPAL